MIEGMPALELTDIAMRHGSRTVLEPLSLAVEAGELIVIVGASGCGKSTLLRLIAGLDAPSAGRLAIDGRDVTGMAPAARGVAMVFQNYALYPHLSVAQNIGFPLSVARTPRGEIAARVAEVAAVLGLADLLDRRPHQLSGGERQRVAIGRAIVREPRLLLLDEPLSNLDTGLRVRMRHELARLHQRLGCTMIYVTHDQLEAMTLANRIVVMAAGRIEQVADASISGDFGQFFKLPGGPLQFSFGGEYRRESSAFRPSANLLNGAFLTYNEPTVAVRSGGHFDVKEAFGELNAPILSGQRFAETLSVGAAYRYSSYSTVGSTTTWQVNGVYAPVRDISIRGSYGKAVRAPNIGELFQPATATSAFIGDPCTPQEIGHGTSYRAASCAALLQSLGATGADLQTGSNIFGTTSGNANLKAERARTWTAGVVLRPRWIHGLTLSVDWYDINLKDAINTAQPTDLVDLCVDQPTLDNQFCGQVTRQQGTGRVIGYVVQPQNVARFRTAGADLNLDYLLRTTRMGTFDLRLVGGYLHRLQLLSLPGAYVTDNLDQFGSPRWTLDFSPSWTLGGFTLSYNLRWFDKTRTQPKLVTDNDPDYAPAAQLRYSALWQHDVQVQYQFPGGLALYLGATNLTDQKPDAGNSINAPISAVGRFLYAGAKVAIGSK